MAIIKVGNFDDIGVKAGARGLGKSAGWTGKRTVRLPRSMSLGSVRHLSTKPKGLNLVRSVNPWAMFLKDITLHKGFEGFLGGLLNKNNEIFFTTFAWDYSGRRPKVFPYVTLDPSEFILKMRKGDTRRFIGDGASLWPSRRVSGALNVVILVYESDQEVQRGGEVVESIHSAVDKSTLTNLVTLISADPTAATVKAVAGALKDLVQTVGKIMKKNRNDVVELFEGSYGTHHQQVSRIEKYDTDAAGIRLKLEVG